MAGWSLCWKPSDDQKGRAGPRTTPLQAKAKRRPSGALAVLEILFRRLAIVQQGRGLRDSGIS